MRQQLVFVSQGLGDGSVGVRWRDTEQKLTQQPQGEVKGFVEGAGVGDDCSEELRQDGVHAGQRQRGALRSNEV